MDKYNVINQLDSLDDLEADMRQWLALPHEFKFRSDEECIRQHGCSNIVLYNNLKADFLKDIATNDTVNEVFDNFEEVDVWKVEYSNQLNQSPYIAIIYPADVFMNVESLDAIYKKYVLLNDKDKRISNSYSFNLWNFNVPNMYTIMLSKIRKHQFNQSFNESLKPDLFEGFKDYYLKEAYMEEADKMINKLDIEGLNALKETISQHHDKYFNSIIDYIDESIEANDFNSILPPFCPWYTETEAAHCRINVKNFNSYMEFRREFLESTRTLLYTIDKKQSDANKIVECGWSPVPFVKDYDLGSLTKIAKDKQAKWLKANAVKITISSDKKPDVKQGYRPIYIVSNNKFNYDDMKVGIFFGEDFIRSYLKYSDGGYLIQKNTISKINGIHDIYGLQEYEIVEFDVFEENFKAIQDALKSAKNISDHIPKIIHLLLISSTRMEYLETKRLFYTEIITMLCSLAAIEIPNNPEVKYIVQIS